FLTPNGEPFHGGTYFPPSDRHGLPGFPRVLTAISAAYRERPDDVRRAVGQLVSVLRTTEPQQAAATLDPTLPEPAATSAVSHVAHHHGGLGDARTSPHAATSQLFLRQSQATGRQEFRALTILTADRMSAGGMYDHIGGGFHRYAVDARWLV